jgi:hypothetical protein
MHPDWKPKMKSSTRDKRMYKESLEDLQVRQAHAQVIFETGLQAYLYEQFGDAVVVGVGAGEPGETALGLNPPEGVEPHEFARIVNQCCAWYHLAYSLRTILERPEA